MEAVTEAGMKTGMEAVMVSSLLFAHLDHALTLDYPGDLTTMPTLEGMLKQAIALVPDTELM